MRLPCYFRRSTMSLNLVGQERFERSSSGFKVRRVTVTPSPNRNWSQVVESSHVRLGFSEECYPYTHRGQKIGGRRMNRTPCLSAPSGFEPDCRPFRSIFLNGGWSVIRTRTTFSG